MNRADWAYCVTRMNRIWPTRKLDTETANEWYRQIGERETTRVDAAITTLSATSKYMPSLADLLETLRSVKNERLLEAPRADPPADPDSEYVKLLSRLVRGLMAKRVPRADYLALTEYRSEDFTYAGKANHGHVEELRNYLIGIGEMDSPEPVGNPLDEFAQEAFR